MQFLIASRLFVVVGGAMAQAMRMAMAMSGVCRGNNIFVGSVGCDAMRCVGRGRSAAVVAAAAAIGRARAR